MHSSVLVVSIKVHLVEPHVEASVFINNIIDSLHLLNGFRGRSSSFFNISRVVSVFDSNSIWLAFLCFLFAYFLSSRKVSARDVFSAITRVDHLDNFSRLDSGAVTLLSHAAANDNNNNDD